MKKYGIVVVGCGYMGAAHLNEIYYRDNIEIIGLVDIDEDKAKAAMKRYGALSYCSSYKGYLEDPNVDIVIIATYPDTHLCILKDCLQSKKHVLCEKPIAATLEEASEFFELVKSSESKVLIGHILRHNETYIKVAQMIQEDLIGKPLVIRMIQNKHTLEWSRYRELINNTSLIVDCGVHYIDVMQWFTGAKITAINGIGTRIEQDLIENKYNYGIFTAVLSDGSIAYYESGWGNTFASEDVKEFIGPKGRIRIIYRKDRVTHQEEGDLIEFYQYPEKEYKMINVDANRKPTYEQFMHLTKMIEENVEAVPTIEEVYNAFCIALEIDDKIKNRQMVGIF